VNLLEAALADLAGFLSESRVPYMVIGGFANLKWGRPRLTQDLDLMVRVPDDELSAFLTRLGKRYHLLAPDPLGMARETRVVPLATSAGVRADLILAGLDYEEAAVRRAVSVPVAGTTVCLCTAEDLVILKLASQRLRDQEDAEGVIVRQGPALDRAYLEPLVQQVATELDRPAIVEFYRACLGKAGITP
jgi:hypothetical protein